MSLPTKITLKGRYVKTTGVIPTTDDVPETGKIKIISEDYVKNSADDVICPPHQLEVELDDTGYFEASVISTDDPAWLPINRTLIIKETLSGGTRTYRIAVPAATPGGELDLADVSPVVNPSPPVTYVLISSFVAKGDILVGTGANTFTRLPIGANSQVLTADSSQPTGTKWTSGGGGGGISPAIINAKGDLIVGAADDVPDRLGVGTNGQVLTADSAQAFGVKWSDPPAGAVSSVNGQTGVVVLTKTSVGLGNVDNTSDANKPVSSATQTALNGKQDLDADLTAIAALAPPDDNVLQRKAGAWTSRTMAQLKTDLAITEADVSGLTTDLAGKQPLDSDLTAIAALAPADDSFLQRKAGAWTGRTMAQLKTDLVLTKGDVGLGNVDNTSDASKPVSTATQTALDGKQPLDSDLTAIAALAPADDSVLQRKSSAWVGRTPAQLKTDLVLTKSDVGLGNVDNTSDATKFANTSLTGTTTINKVVITPDTITISAGNADTDASLGNHFRISATANFTLTNPTNPSDTQRVMWEITQDATGGRTITLGAKFALGSDITSITLSTGANKKDLLGAVYNQALDKWLVCMFVRGF